MANKTFGDFLPSKEGNSDAVFYFFAQFQALLSSKERDALPQAVAPLSTEHMKEFFLKMRLASD